MVHKRCPVCHSTLPFEPFLRCKDYTVSQDNFDIVSCASCNFLFTNPVPDESEIARFYKSEDYISHSNTKKGLINTLYLWVRNYTLKKKHKFICRVSGLKNGVLIDYGCGTGDFLRTMKEAGWKVSGFEPSEVAREFAQTVNGFSIHEPDALFSWPKESTDVITLWHVLEHIHQLDETLVTIKSILKPSGTLIIAVPNSNAWDAKHYGAYWAAYDVPRHLYHFSPQTLGLLLERHGLKIVESQLMPFDAYYVSLLSEKYKTGRTSLINGFINGWKSNRDASKNPNHGSSRQYVIKKV